VLPEDEKSVYMEAMEEAPELVQVETDAMQFVRICDRDIWAAAKRLCNYWKERKVTFKERAFLPMTITGDGALTKEDTLCLQAGYPCVIPQSTCGKIMVYGDRRQALATATFESKSRCCFYFAKKMAEHEQVQTEGFHALLLLVVPRAQDIDHRFMKYIWGLCGDAYPIKINIHYLCYFPKMITGLHYFAQEVISKAVVYAMERGGRFLTTEVHIEQEPGDVLDSLYEMGLTQTGLPKDIGGTWTYKECLKWCRHRITEEREWERNYHARQEQRRRVKQANNSPALPINQPTIATSSAASDTVASSAARASSRQPRPQSQSSSNNRTIERRGMGAILSRRKRERDAQELRMLRQEKEDLLKVNKRLKSEQIRLNSLLGEAGMIITSLPRGRSTVVPSESRIMPANQQQEHNPTTTAQNYAQPVEDPFGPLPVTGTFPEASLLGERARSESSAQANQQPTRDDSLLTADLEPTPFAPAQDEISVFGLHEHVNDDEIILGLEFSNSPEEETEQTASNRNEIIHPEQHQQPEVSFHQQPQSFNQHQSSTSFAADSNTRQSQTDAPRRGFMGWPLSWRSENPQPMGPRESTSRVDRQGQAQTQSYEEQLMTPQNQSGRVSETRIFQEAAAPQEWDQRQQYNESSLPHQQNKNPSYAQETFATNRTVEELASDIQNCSPGERQRLLALLMANHGPPPS